MKKIVFLLGIILIAWSAQAQLFCSYKKQINYPLPSFNSYYKYPGIYTAKDAAQIRFLQKQFEKQKKTYKCYKKFDEQYNHYNRLTQIGLKRYEKKKKRSLRKALKYGQKFIDVCMVAYLDLDSLYTAKIFEIQGKNKLPDSLKYLADSLKSEINKVNFQIANAKAQAISNKGIKRVEKFMQACSLNKTKLDWKETYISLLMRDKNTIKFLKQKYPKPTRDTIPPVDTTRGPGVGKNQPHSTKRPRYYIPRIDELAPYLKLSTEERVKNNNYKELLEKIQNTEAILNTSVVKDTVSLMAKLGDLYYQAYRELYNIYAGHLTQKELQQVDRYYTTAEIFYNKYQKNKSLSDLWQAVHYIIPAVITAENILSQRYKLGGQYNVADIIPKAKTANVPAKTKQKTQKQKQQQTGKIHCTPSSVVYTYDLNNPKARLLRESGTYYRIYVGTSTRYVLPKEFADYQPITYIKVCKEKQYKQKRYYVGKFTDKQKALAAARRLYRDFGIKAKVVTFVNGHPKGIVKDNVSSSNNLYGVPDITTTKYLVYAIRLGTYTLPKHPHEIKHLRKLYYQITSDGKYAYYDGLYYHYQEASSALAKLKNMGYSDAYIRAFNNGEVISISRAKAIERNVNTSGKVIFGVQVGAFSKPLSQENYRKLYSRLGTNYQVSMIEKGGMFVYYVYAGTTYNQAKEMKQKIRRLGYTDAFVIAIKNNKIVPLSEVIR